MMQKTLNPLLNSTSEFYLKISVFGICTWKKWNERNFLTGSRDFSLVTLKNYKGNILRFTPLRPELL